MRSPNECDKRILEDRVEILENEKRDREYQEEEERRRQKKDQQEQYKESLRRASDWPEAFQKQRLLIAPELRMAADELAKIQSDTHYVDQEQKQRDLDWWTEDVENLRSSLAGIDESERIYAEEARKAEKEIAAIRKRMLSAVAQTIRNTVKSDGCFVQELLNHLEDDNPEGWLDW